MKEKMLLLILYLALALIVSFICSIMESVLLSIPPSFLMVKKDEGHPWASLMEKLKVNIDKPLSAILSLNTVAHTIGAAGVGAQAIKVFGEQWFGLVSAMLTLLILIITEIIPKTIGARYWRNLTPFAAYTINIMVWITYPLVLMSAVLTRLISRRRSMQSTSREEIAAMASIGANEGVFNEKEYRIIQNMLRLRDVRVTEIITPRVVVAVANEDMYLNDFLKNKNYLKFSRIPVYAAYEENITGYVFRQTVFEKLAEDHHELKLSDLKRPIVIVHNTMPLFSVWDKLLQKKEHIALIVDEYGGMDGIVTMEDIIETLLGLEIVDETDTVRNMQQYARERWKTRQAKYNLLEGLQKRDE